MVRLSLFTLLRLRSYSDPGGQRGDLRHLQEEPRCGVAQLLQPEQTNRPSRVLDYCIPPVRWFFERRS